MAWRRLPKASSAATGKGQGAVDNNHRITGRIDIGFTRAAVKYRLRLVLARQRLQEIAINISLPGLSGFRAGLLRIRP